jgi:23S rRNA U2552 (ribose-2'-O)-methylase RlmE/FtsJ
VSITRFGSARQPYKVSDKDSLLDRVVDPKGNTEVVRGENQRRQLAALRRSFKNWKNSTPSRSRRFII